MIRTTGEPSGCTDSIAQGVIDRRRQQHSFLAVETLVVRAVAPGFGVAQPVAPAATWLRQARSTPCTLARNFPCPTRATMMDSRWVSGIFVFSRMSCSTRCSHRSRSDSRDGLNYSARSTSFATSLPCESLFAMHDYPHPVYWLFRSPGGASQRQLMLSSPSVAY